jgi:ABC-type transport system involved in multi-copper enzyme maturation permease subunit
MSRLAPLLAQVEAEVKMRTRSFATPLALLALCVGAYLWIPDPSGNVSSISWDLPGGRLQGPVYSASYVGFAASVLVSIFVPLVGFYLVAGSVRRDRERGVGRILAATPLTKGEYLAGKFAAHVAYLLVIAALALAVTFAAWLRFGVGTFSAGGFLVPFLVLSLPTITITAALAVLFDVTPGLRSRGGLVVWFFVFAMLLIALPMELAGGGEKGELHRLPAIDPAGAATQVWLARQTVPDAQGFSTGYTIHDRPIERVPWKGVRVTGKLVAVRAGNVALAVVPLLLAVLVFDRFDPARGGRRRRRARKEEEPGRTGAVRLADRFRDRLRRAGDAGEPASAASVVEPASLTPVSVRPSVGGAVLAEVRLLWTSASWIKWPLLASAVVAGAVPHAMAGAAFLVLLVPIIAEAAAREELAGTRALVFSQPAVPARPVLWKCAAVAVFVLGLGLPMAVRAFVESSARGVECVAGLLAIAGISVAFGSLTAGGKLFSGVFLAVWYMAVSGLPQADVTGVLSKAPSLRVSLAALGLGVLLVTIAAASERLRADRA